MAVRTPSLKRDPESGNWKARKAIPEGIRDAYAASYGPRYEAKFSARAGCPRGRRQGAVHQMARAHRSPVSDRARQGPRQGATLSHGQLHALVGDRHKWFAAEHPEPGQPSDWDAAEDAHGEAVEQICKRFVHSDLTADLNAFDWTEHKQARPMVLAQIASAARVDAFLTQRIELLSDKSDAFLIVLAKELPVALNTMKQLAGGNYSASVKPERFPVRTKAAGLTPTQLFAAYVIAKKSANNTVIRWRSIFIQLDKFFPDRDAGSLTEDDAFAWREDLRKRLTDKSVR